MSLFQQKNLMRLTGVSKKVVGLLTEVVCLISQPTVLSLVVLSAFIETVRIIKEANTVIVVYDNYLVTVIMPTIHTFLLTLNKAIYRFKVRSKVRAPICDYRFRGVSPMRELTLGCSKP